MAARAAAFLLMSIAGATVRRPVFATEPTKTRTLMPQGAKDHRLNFSLTFRSAMDSDVEIARIHGPSNQAMLVTTRRGDDTPGPIGLFSTTLTREQTLALAAAVDGIKWNGLPDPAGGDISSAALSIDFSRGKKVIQRSFNSRNSDILDAIAPFMRKMAEIETGLLTKPRRAVDIDVLRTVHGFKLVIRNVGSGPVILADPRTKVGSTGLTRGTVSVAKREKDPNQFPTFNPVPIQPLDAPPAPIVLAAGQAHEIETVAWTPSGPGNYFAMAKWEDYTGPAVDPKTVMPAIPDPENIDDPHPFVIRGALFSDDLKFSVEGSHR
jgi:hypothetical protein